MHAANECLCMLHQISIGQTSQISNLPSLCHAWHEHAQFNEKKVGNRLQAMPVAWGLGKPSGFLWCFLNKSVYFTCDPLCQGVFLVKPCVAASGVGPLGSTGRLPDVQLDGDLSRLVTQSSFGDSVGRVSALPSRGGWLELFSLSLALIESWGPKWARLKNAISTVAMAS